MNMSNVLIRKKIISSFPWTENKPGEKIMVKRGSKDGGELEKGEKNENRFSASLWNMPLMVNIGKSITGNTQRARKERKENEIGTSLRFIFSRPSYQLQVGFRFPLRYSGTAGQSGKRSLVPITEGIWNKEHHGTGCSQQDKMHASDRMGDILYKWIHRSFLSSHLLPGSRKVCPSGRLVNAFCHDLSLLSLFLWNTVEHSGTWNRDRG